MKQKGFTLVEVLIALFIAVLASVYVAKTITSTNKVVAAGKDSFIATNLAHEGIDLTRALRDTTWLKYSTTPAKTNWMSESGICEDTGMHRYTVDPDIVRNFLNYKTKVPNDEMQVLYNKSNGANTNTIWTHAVTSEQTPYSRVLQVDCAQVNAAPAFVTITSTVSWVGQNGVWKEVSMKEQLYNWMP